MSLTDLGTAVKRLGRKVSIQIQVSHATYDALALIAKARKVSRAEVVREMIAGALEAQK